jgi:hypothetical protein
MSDYNNIPSADSPGIYSPQDFSIQSLDFITSSGGQIDLKKLMVEMSIYEDLYAFSMSGHIDIRDAQGFIELLQLTGNEFIKIDFGKMKNAPNNIVQTFKVYKVGNRKPDGNQNTENYTIYFCSEELMLSEQSKISQSYKGKKISEIVQDVLTTKLKVPSKKIELIEPTTGVYDIVVPRLKPFEAVSWLSLYARPSSTNLVGADMLFFETKNGYNFRSLQSMYAQPIYATYKHQPQNLSEQSFQDKITSVLKYELVKSYDSLNDTNSGAFANRLISIDPLTRTFRTTDFSLSKYRQQSKSLNPGAPTNLTTNRLGIPQDQNYNANFKVSVSNSNQSRVPYIKEREGATTKDIFIETIIPFRTAQISLANYTVLKLSIPGDPGITVGRTIQFNVLSLKPTQTRKDLDNFYSGKYLVTAVRHVVQAQGVYQTILEVAKDSTNAEYSSVDINSSNWKSVTNE